MSNKITPDGIRVWQGYRNELYRNDINGFMKKLGDIFIPITVQLMTPMGLNMYYPSIVPHAGSSRSSVLPDEVALVGYPSQDIYTAASKGSVAGRSYGALHSTVFNFSATEIPASTSNFPIIYQGNASFKWNTPFYFSGQAIDWNALNVGVMIWEWAEGDNSFNATELLGLCADTLKNDANTVEIITVLQRQYGVLWFATSAAEFPHDIVQMLTRTQSIMALKTFHHLTLVDPLFCENDPGINVTSGQALDVRLST
ncbi:hypothetical protein [Enterovibrio baiacu]|uniref:hypothetical protein n=1 Tax=Enterovibrio baiacu TaxID=2491023 RepID=UPI003D0CB8BD